MTDLDVWNCEELTGLDVCGTMRNCDKFRCMWNCDRLDVYGIVRNCDRFRL